MENQITNLENAPQIGIIQCLKQGIVECYKNFTQIAKMAIPVIHITLGCILMVLPIFFIHAPKFVLIGSFGFFIVGVVYFIWAFWQYLIGITAVSYLAKDIFENKEIKSPEEYFSYVKEYGKSYVKYWLLVSLIYIILAVIFVGIGFILAKLKLNIVFLIFTICLCAMLLWPFSLGIGISYYFWAYGDKTRVLDCIFKSIKTVYQNAIKTVSYFLLMGIVVLIITFPIFIALSLITFVTAVPITKAFVSDAKLASEYINMIANILQNFVYCVATYFISFASTRFYFELINKK